MWTPIGGIKCLTGGARRSVKARVSNEGGGAVWEKRRDGGGRVKRREEDAFM